MDIYPTLLGPILRHIRELGLFVLDLVSIPPPRRPKIIPGV